MAGIFFDTGFLFFMRIGQFKILIENGIIKEYENTPGGVHIISDEFDLKLDNAYVYLGFIDAHGHLLALGKKLNTLDLSDCKSSDDCIEKAKKYIPKTKNWLTGRGWNQENWQEKVFPSKNMLDKVFSDTPVYFTRIDGHAAWVNTKALQLAGIDNSTPDPAGGKIIRNDKSEPTGILIDNAMLLVGKLIPEDDEKTQEKFIIKAVDELLRNGLTGINDMDVSHDLVSIFKRLDEAGKLKIKVNAYLQGQNDEWLNGGIEPYHGKNYHITGVKFYADGALGSYGAALLEPYSDDNSTNGLLLIDYDTLYNKAKAAVESGFNVATHAIGDAANRLVLRVYADLRENGLAGKNTILRIEHAQIIQPADIEYFKKYDISASIQPIHCLSDASMARKRLGDRVKYAYPWATLQKAGVKLFSGSDFPIESHNPLIGIDALVNRIPFNDNKPWFPEECLSIEKALNTYTINTRNISNNYGHKRGVSAVSIADFVVLDSDLTQIEHKDFTDVKVLATIINGKLAYVNSNYK